VVPVEQDLPTMNMRNTIDSKKQVDRLVRTREMKLDEQANYVRTAVTITIFSQCPTGRRTGDGHFHQHQHA
jgi:hypothetical protein